MYVAVTLKVISDNLSIVSFCIRDAYIKTVKLQSRCIVTPSCKRVGFRELIRLQMICIRGEFASRCSVPQNKLRGAVNENETGVCVCMCVCVCV